MGTVKRILQFDLEFVLALLSLSEFSSFFGDVFVDHVVRFVWELFS